MKNPTQRLLFIKVEKSLDLPPEVKYKVIIKKRKTIKHLFFVCFKYYFDVNIKWSKRDKEVFNRKYSK